MQTSPFADMQLSRFMLGTVQFGLKYGIANTTGQPTVEQIRDILTCAAENGVNCLDTAAAYGTSEQVLGQVLTETNLHDHFTIVTKVPHLADTFSSAQALNECVEDAVTTSLKRLRLDVLPICMFHKESNIAHIDSLLRLRDKGLIRYVGASAGSPDGAAKIIDTDQVRAVQMPTSILDHRYRRLGHIEQARQRDIAVFIRSVYLQGLIFRQDNDLPAQLASVRPVLHSLRQMAAEHDMSIAQMAMRYALGIPGVTCLVVGVDTAEQLRQNLDVCGRGALPQSLQQRIDHEVPALDEQILNPSLWPQRMPDARPVTK